MNLDSLPDRFVLFYPSGKPKRFTRLLPNQWLIEEWEGEWKHFGFSCSRYVAEGLSKAECYAPTKPTGITSERIDSDLAWAVQQWNAEVKNRPLENIHYRTLDATWRQVIRHFGGDDKLLCVPRC